MKNILLLIHDDEGQEARFQVALDLTRALRGHLHCLNLTPIPEVIGDYAGAAAGAFVDERKAEEANRLRMLQRLEREALPFDWIDCTGFIAPSLADHAGLTDLIVLSSDAPGTLFPQMGDAAGELLTSLATPLLLVPVAARRLNVTGRALIAWDGSADAEAVLKQAIPLLASAARVTLFYFDDGSEKISVEEAARYLSRYDIKTTIKHQANNLRSATKAIFAEAMRGQYDYMVMGAFSRPRMIEILLGGATQKMLRAPPIPALLAHAR